MQMPWRQAGTIGHPSVRGSYRESPKTRSKRPRTRFNSKERDIHTRWAMDMDALDLEDCLKVAIEAATAAGDVILCRFEEQQRQRWGCVDGAAADKIEIEIETKKGAADLVTATDKECERIIADKLHQRFPSHAFIGEESEAAACSDRSSCENPISNDNTPTWMVDPLVYIHIYT